MSSTDATNVGDRVLDGERLAASAKMGTISRVSATSVLCEFVIGEARVCGAVAEFEFGGGSVTGTERLGSWILLRPKSSCFGCGLPKANAAAVSS